MSKTKKLRTLLLVVGFLVTSCARVGTEKPQAQVVATGHSVPTFLLPPPPRVSSGAVPVVVAPVTAAAGGFELRWVVRTNDWINGVWKEWDTKAQRDLTRVYRVQESADLWQWRTVVVTNWPPVRVSATNQAGYFRALEEWR